MTPDHAAEVEAGTRFTFGENWSRFLSVLDGERIRQAEDSLRQMLHVETLQGRTFLDIGSGSGLFSLAARRLGASVRSIDYDPQSVACTEELRRRYYPGDPMWVVEQGSVLDSECIGSIGRFDVVYSWGVLHHTGDMWRALSLIGSAVEPGGQLFLAIYNDQGLLSRYWARVKAAYNRSVVARVLLTALHAPYLLGARWVVRALTNRSRVERGMSLWYDMIDWLGGYPFEVAKPEAIFRIFHDQGFVLQELRTCGGRMGCNEFVFRRNL